MTEAAASSAGLQRPLLVESEDRLVAALQSRADTLLLTFASDAREWQQIVREITLAARGAGPDIYARVDLDAPSWMDGDSCVLAHVSGEILSSAEARNLDKLAGRLAVAEARCGLQDGALRILAHVADTASVLSLATSRSSETRLIGLIFDAEAVALALGTEPDAEPVVTARGVTLLAANALRMPILASAVRGLQVGDVQRGAERAKAGGFFAQIAASPADLETIAAVFGR